MKPLRIAFVWHMHQPYYKDDLTATYLLPWVRLRSSKDYFRMAAILDGYPSIRQTYNLVPSLLAQIEDYVSGDYQDLFLNLSRRPAGDLNPDERRFLLKWMRESPRFPRVQASQRYLQLASRPETEVFTTEDLRDLQVWFNLAWCDPQWVDTDPKLSALKAKDRHFSEEEKHSLLDLQLGMMSKVIPKYRELADRGQIELTFSPYHHPILPLLCHSDTARTAIPDIALPDPRFSHQEDADRQIELGKAACERLLGRQPQGMWPSELAVGESVARLAVRSGISWFLADEDVLARSLDVHLGRDGDGCPHQPDLLYTPYTMDREGGQVGVVFRDGALSNLIGFDYQRMHAIEAVRDFMGRLHRIRDSQGDRDFLVTIALDGENPWDFYARDGHDFLNTLYTELEKDDSIITTTISDFLAENPGGRPLQWLHTGSWIGANLDTWIGDPEQNSAWTLLGETREWLRDFAEHRPAESQQVAAAWAELFVAEGSDWFWWFSRRHDSGMDAIWDNQFRLHLRNVYRVVGAKPPARLFQPITDRSVAVQIQAPTGEISPQSMDDVVWEKAGRFEVAAGFGSLHRSIGLIETLLYGSDSDHLYLRLDSSARGADLLASKIEFWVFVSGAPASIPVGAKDSFVLPVHAGALEELDFEPGFVIGVKAASEGATITVSHLAEDPNLAVPVYVADSANPLFIKVPFTALEKKGGEPIQLAVVVTKDGAAVEQVPPQGSLRLRVPSRNSADEGLPVDRLRILIAAAEATPLAKSGNVADMTTWLAKELRRQGQDARLIMPRYRHISLQAIGAREVIGTLPVPLGQETVNCSIWEAAIGDVPVFLVDCPQFFGRDAMFGFGDDDARFIYFSRAVIEALEPLGFVPDVLHVNDWHTALIPNLLDRLYSGNPALAGIATVLTIHNLEFQGTFGSGTLHLAGLESWGLLKIGIPQLDDVVKLLGRGIHYSDAFNTVSERYAQEIQTPELGEGMDQMIKTNAHKLYGIVNGIDYDAFDPQSDAALPQGFSEADLSGKALAKAELRQQLGLPQLDLPLVVMISRLYETKGLDLIEQALPSLLEMKLQVAIMGAGDRRYEDLLSHQAKQNPDRLAVQVGFDPKLAQLMYGGGDMFLMPSRTEPCGLGQLIAVRYGTIPIVRSTGGLADTVEDVDPQANTGFGFVFDSYQSAHLLAATIRAAETYRHRRFWRELVRRAMSQDVSWGHSARRYTQLYRAAMMSHRERTGRASARAGRAR